MLTGPRAVDDRLPPPVAVGGVGGSGTRLVAGLLRRLGIRIGVDLNASDDCLWFTLLFKRREILRSDDIEFGLLVRTLRAGLRGGEPLDDAQRGLLERLAAHDRPQHDAGWLRLRAASLEQAASGAATAGRWGWKEPNTHTVIDRIWKVVPELRYVHVVRHGVEVAYGSNQNQVRLWGGDVLGGDDIPSPARSLAFWCRVQQRMEIVHADNRDRMHWLDYDALCRDPDGVLPGLCRFLGVGAEVDPRALRDLVRPAAARAAITAEGFDARDIAYVRSLGYRVPAG